MIAGRFVTMASLRLDGAAALHAALMDEITRFAAAGFQDDATLLVVAIA